MHPGVSLDFYMMDNLKYSYMLQEIMHVIDSPGVNGINQTHRRQLPEDCLAE